MMKHVERMKKEYNELKTKCTDLSKFVHLNPLFKTLCHDEQIRMISQLAFMQSYLDVLNARICCTHN